MLSTGHRGAEIVEYSIGTANVTLTADRAFKVGKYLGNYYSKGGKRKIVIGKNTRLSSYDISIT